MVASEIEFRLAGFFNQCYDRTEVRFQIPHDTTKLMTHQVEGSIPFAIHWKSFVSYFLSQHSPC